MRDMVPWEEGFLVLAGDYHAEADALPQRLYWWAGPGSDPEPCLLDFGDCNPEALIVHGDSGSARLQILSDDGNRQIGGEKACKKLASSPEKQRFRSYWLEDWAKPL